MIPRRDSSTELRGVAVLVTRPAGETAGLRRLIAARGGIAICQPGIELAAAAAGEPTLRHLRRIGAHDWIVFTSPAAVRHGWSLLEAGGLSGDAKFWGVGERSAADLKRIGAANVGAPRAGAGSDALLADPAFARVHERRILILCARGGRSRLQDALSERGARVQAVYVYRRRPPRLRRPALARLREYFPRSIITATSAAILANVTALYRDRLPAPLTRRPLVVVSRRIADEAAELGFTRIAVCSDPSAEGIVAGVAGLAVG